MEHPEAVDRNRQQQKLRDRKRHLRNLANNTSARDLTHSAAAVWLVRAGAASRSRTFLSPEKTSDLLNLKKRLGLPDSRHDATPIAGMQECQLCDMPENPGGISVLPRAYSSSPQSTVADDMEALVKSVTDAVMAALATGGSA